MGCLRSIGCLTVAILGAIGGYFTRDLWWERVTGQPARPGIVWEGPIREAERSDPASRIRRPDGAAFVSLTPAQLATLIEGSLAGAANQPEVAITDDEVRARAMVDLTRLPQVESLGPAGRLLQGKPQVEVAGRPSVESPGVGRLVVTDVRVGGVQLPQSARSALFAQLARSMPSLSVEGNTVKFSVPRSVGDIRVAQGKVTVYKGRP